MHEKKRATALPRLSAGASKEMDTDQLTDAGAFPEFKPN